MTAGDIAERNGCARIDSARQFALPVLSLGHLDFDALRIWRRSVGLIAGGKDINIKKVIVLGVKGNSICAGKEPVLFMNATPKKVTPRHQPVAGDWHAATTSANGWHARD